MTTLCSHTVKVAIRLCAAVVFLVFTQDARCATSQEVDREAAQVRERRAIVKDASAAPADRLQAAQDLAATGSLWEEHATQLFMDLVTSPDVPLELRVSATIMALETMRKEDVLSILAGFCDDTDQKEILDQISSRFDESFLLVILRQFLEGSDKDRLAPAKLLCKLDFPRQQWDLLFDVNRSEVNVYKLIQTKEYSLAQDPMPMVRLAIAKVLMRDTAGGLKKVLLSSFALLGTDADLEVRNEILGATRPAPATGGVKQQNQQALRSVNKKIVPTSRGIAAADGGAQPSAGEAKLSTSRKKPSDAEVKPSTSEKKSPDEGVKPSANGDKPSGEAALPVGSPYGGKKKEVALFRARAAAIRDLRGQDWFPVSFAVSSTFRKRFEKLVFSSAEKGVKRPLKEKDLPEPVPFSVTAPLPETPILLNGIFVGRAPLTELRVPPDTYTVTALGSSSNASRQVTVSGHSSSVAFTGADFNESEATPSAPPEAAEFASPDWWQTVEARDVDAVVAVPGGVAILVTENGNPRLRLYERTRGITLWDVGIGLAPTSPLALHGGSLYWGAADALLHAVDLASGAISTVTVLGGTLDLAAVPAGGLLLCPTWDGSDGGRVTAVNPGSGQKSWTVPFPGRPRKLLVLGDTVVIAAGDQGGGGKIICLRAVDGNELWIRPVRRVEGLLLAGDGNMVFLQDGEPGSHGAFLDGRTATTVFTVLPEGGAAVTDVLVRGDRAAFTTSDARISWVDLTSRSVRWSRSLPGSDAREVRLLDVVSDAISVIAGAVRPTAAGQARVGYLRLIAPWNGGTIYKVGISLLDAPISVGSGLMLLSDVDGEIAVRDLTRGWTPLEFSTAGEGKGNDALRVLERDKTVYLVSKLRNRIYAFDLKARRLVGAAKRQTGP